MPIIPSNHSYKRRHSRRDFRKWRRGFGMRDV